jgi:hypothetical protein
MATPCGLTLIRPLRGYLLPLAGEGIPAPQKFFDAEEALGAPLLPLATACGRRSA